MSDSIKNLMGDTVEKIKSMASVDTIIGDPVDLGDGIKAIPVSKLSYGFASGGSDIPTSKTNKDIFGGGGGAGVTVTPVAFLVVQNSNVKMLNVDLKPTSLDRAVDLVPDMFDRVVSTINKFTGKKDDDSAVEEAIEKAKSEE